MGQGRGGGHPRDRWLVREGGGGHEPLQEGEIIGDGRKGVQSPSDGVGRNGTRGEVGDWQVLDGKALEDVGGDRAIDEDGASGCVPEDRRKSMQEGG
jgi:hypothetical protein